MKHINSIFKILFITTLAVSYIGCTDNNNKTIKKEKPTTPNPSKYLIEKIYVNDSCVIKSIGKDVMERKTSDGGKYIGSYKNKKMQGKGIYTWSDGSCYVGYFENGVINGTGILFHKDGGKYIGQFKNGMMNGRGVYIWPDGEKYIGEVKDGSIHGKGSYFYRNGTKYVGQFNKGRLHGFGDIYQTNGTITKNVQYKNNRMVKQ